MKFLYRMLINLMMAVTCAAGFSSAYSTPYYISMFQLMACPDTCAGHRFEFYGYLENRVVYLTESAARFKDMANGIAIVDDRVGLHKSCENSYVRIVGKAALGEDGEFVLMNIEFAKTANLRESCMTNDV